MTPIRARRALVHDRFVAWTLTLISDAGIETMLRCGGVRRWLRLVHEDRWINMAFDVQALRDVLAEPTRLR